MFTLAGIRTFHGWTHASLAMVLDHLASMPEGSYEKELTGFGFPTLRAQIVHIFQCESFWIHALRAVPFKNEYSSNWKSVSDARRLQREVGAGTLAYLSGLTEEQLNRNAELHFADGDRAVRTPALILHHLLTHAFHHKGQIVSMCRVLGYPAFDTDLNQFE